MRNEITNRVKYPFVGGFIISYITLNIKGILVFSMMSDEQRLNLLLKKNIDYLGNDLLYPFILTVFYLVVIPVLVNIYDEWKCGLHLSHQEKINEKETKLIDIELAKEKETRREMMINNIKDWSEERKTLQKELNLIKEKVQLFENINDKLKIQIEENERNFRIHHETAQEIYELLDGSESYKHIDSVKYKLMDINPNIIPF